MYRYLLPILFLLLMSCTLQPISEPRRPNPETEPTMVPTAIAIEKPTYVVASGSVSAQLVKSGWITPVHQQQLGFEIDGRIAALLINKDDMVQIGDAVAMLDTTILEQSLETAVSDLNLAQVQLSMVQESKETDLRRAEIGVELAQLQLDFAIEEAGESPTSEQKLTIEVRKRELELAQLTLRKIDNVVDPSLLNQVTQAQQQVDRIQIQINQSTLVSPISGTVMIVNFNEGDTVSAGETLFVIADLTQVEVQIPVIDRELQLLAEDLVAVGMIPAQPETRFPMTVRQLPFPYGTGAQDNEADSAVRISFDDPDSISELGIGDRLELSILLDQHDDVLWLPPAAIREFNGRLFVVVQEGEGQRRLDIQTGLQNDSQIEIISGVSEGQIVVGP